MTQGPVLLTGATGLLGYWLAQSAAPDTELVAVTHTRRIADVPSFDADLREPDAITEVIQMAGPSLVIHAAYAKDHASIVEATRNVVQAAGSANATVMFISSDAVFHGDGIARHERSPADATWDYGRWKAEAEQLVIGASQDNVVIRLPLLVSVDPADHVAQVIQNGAATGTKSQWYVDEIRQPALASEVAQTIWQIANLVAGERAGYWHLPGPESLSRYELAQRINDRLGLPPSTIETSQQPPGSDRPTNIVFSDARARTGVNWRPSTIS